MLKQRIITALVLLAILLPALFHPSPVPFAAVVLLLIAAGGWEWGRLHNCSTPVAWMMGLLCMVLCSAAWLAGWPQRVPQGLWLAAGELWVLAGAWLLHRGVARWQDIPRPVRLVGGIVTFFLAWLAAAQARYIGINFLLSVLLLVWMADIAAYFAGRAFGLKFTNSRLAPTISPGKSWEGVWGGMVGVVVLAWCWVLADAHWQPTVASLYTRLAEQGMWLMLLSVLFLAAMSVVGDLVESLIKRSVGVKDSSGLLPGHGGVLDRVDALLPVLPLAMMLVSLIP